MKAICCGLLAALWVTTAAAQPVYETHDKDGPVFSDLPSAGASKLKLPPAGSATPLPSEAPPMRQADASYASLAIVEPPAGGTIHSNTGEFPVAVALVPALNLERGDALVVSLDGMVLTGTRSSAQFSITADEWQTAAADNVEHQLAVAVVDHSGKVLLSAAPVRFYVHHASRLLPHKN